MKSLRLRHFQQLPVVLTDPATQRRVAAILDEAFEGIATAKATREKNRQNARQLLESHLESVFTLPGKNWTQASLGEVVDFVGGSQPPKSEFISEYGEGLVRLIQIRDYKSDRHIIYIPKRLSKRSCTVQDVMIGRYGPPVFQILRGLEGSYNVALMKAVPDAAKLSKDFLFYFLKHRSIQRFIIGASARAAGQSGLNKDTIEPYPIAFPSLREQSLITERISALVEAMDDLEVLQTRKSSALDELWRSLLHQAFTGAL